MYSSVSYSGTPRRPPLPPPVWGPVFFVEAPFLSAPVLTALFSLRARPSQAILLRGTVPAFSPPPLLSPAARSFAPPRAGAFDGIVETFPTDTPGTWGGSAPRARGMPALRTKTLPTGGNPAGTAPAQGGLTRAQVSRGQPGAPVGSTRPVTWMLTSNSRSCLQAAGRREWRQHNVLVQVSEKEQRRRRR